VQPVTTDIDQFTWRRKPARRGATGGALVEHARHDERGESADDKAYLLDIHAFA
jgi:hypothetical protein